MKSATDPAIDFSLAFTLAIEMGMDNITQSVFERSTFLIAYSFDTQIRHF